MGKDTENKRQEVCILTFARSWNTIAACRNLGEHGVKVITGDNLTLAGGNFSVYSKGFFTYPDPDSDPEGFIDKLIEICNKHNGPDVDLVLMPMHTDSFIVAENKDKFEGVAKLALPDRDKIDLIGNKASLAKFCKEKGINIPQTEVIDSCDEFDDVADSFKYPAFLKISDSNAAIGLHKVDSAEEAKKHFKNDVAKFKLTGKGLAILQEAVPGEDYCSTFLFENGELKGCMTYHNILDYPKKTGMGALRETVDATEMEEIGAKLLALADWHGVAEIDFRWNGEGTPYLIEVNPRFWGGLGQSVESGWNYPYLLFRLAVDGHIEPVPKGSHNVKTFNPCLMSMLMLQEFAEAKNTRSELGDAIKNLDKEISERKDHFKALDNFSDKLAASLNPLDRLKAVKSVMDENKGAVNELFKKKDPLPLLGLLYPLAVFLKHGKVSPEMLVTGAGKSGSKEENTEESED